MLIHYAIPTILLLLNNCYLSNIIITNKTPTSLPTPLPLLSGTQPALIQSQSVTILTDMIRLSLVYFGTMCTIVTVFVYTEYSSLN